MTAIIYEIKHNSALRHVGQLPTSLNRSPLFTACDLVMQSQRFTRSVALKTVLINTLKKKTTQVSVPQPSTPTPPHTNQEKHM